MNNNIAQTTDTRIIQAVITIAVFAMLAAAMFHFSKSTTISSPSVIEWVSDTSWTGGWR